MEKDSCVFCHERKNGANEAKNPLWVNNKQGWMRMDVLWSKESAVPYNEKLSKLEDLVQLEITKLGNAFRDPSANFKGNKKIRPGGGVGSDDKEIPFNRERWAGYWQMMINRNIINGNTPLKYGTRGNSEKLSTIAEWAQKDSPSEWEWGLIDKMHGAYNADAKDWGLDQSLDYLNGLSTLDDDGTTE